ncbi:3'-5' exonuclease [Flagellimonas sp. 389]|uniref:3'-5' exonuclease n=1 Tax=Flagellimonas sp. 389 TaxID=2835862 RepID=UPI001BD3D338|nr:3'-5' exonuclease [Flagellimonas sp. 389]MBS9462167.1 3'-5' exonuclease [Flagellimonas sp. 389]
MMRFFKKKKPIDLPNFWKDYATLFEKPFPSDLKDVRYVVLDTETTGFNYEQDRMLCIGALKLFHKNIAVKESFEVYLSQNHYDVESAEIHGILKKENVEYITELEALQRFLIYVKNDVIVGHHVMFDVNMINAALERHELPKLKNQTLDTGLLYRRTLLNTTVLQKKEHYSLDDLAEKFSISKKDRHTALGDALITAIALLHIIDKLKPEDLKDLIKKQRPLKYGF